MARRPRLSRELGRAGQRGAAGAGRDDPPAARAAPGRSTGRAGRRRGGSARGWCCHSSPRTRSTSPSASAGRACSGSDSTSSQSQVRRVGRELAHRRGSRGAARRTGRPRSAPRPATRPGRCGELGLGQRDALEQRLGVRGQDERRVGQAHAAPGALDQRDAGLALEHRELLRDRRGRELERVGDCGDRAALAQLAQQAQAAKLQHCDRKATE